VRRNRASRLATFGFLSAAIALAWPQAAGAATDVAINANCAGGAIFCYAPAEANANVGDTVTWNNTSGAPHTVTRCTPDVCSGTDGGTGTDSSFGDSGSIASGSSFNHTFTAAGTYNYYCTIHGYGTMHGTVTVAGAQVSTTTPSGTATTVAAPAAAGAATTVAPAQSSATTSTTAATAGGTVAAASTGSSAGTPSSAASSSGSQFARTGSNTGFQVLVAGGLVLAGAIVWRRARRPYEYFVRRR
jgi:plastocyanin